jgi:hypothetical protein
MPERLPFGIPLASLTIYTFLLNGDDILENLDAEIKVMRREMISEKSIFERIMRLLPMSGTTKSNGSPKRCMNMSLGWVLIFFWCQG